MTSSNAVGPGPLSPQHLQALADARVRSKKLRRAVSVATMSGWSMAVFAVITAMGGLLGDVSSLVMAAGLGAVGWNELRGAKMLGRFEAQGARVLGYNQLMLGVVIVAYAAWSMFAAMHAKPESSGSAEVDEMMREYTGVVTYALYGTMAVVGVVVPGFTALYYFSRAKLVRTLHATTPAWVIDALRAAA